MSDPRGGGCGGTARVAFLRVCIPLDITEYTVTIPQVVVTLAVEFRLHHSRDFRRPTFTLPLGSLCQWIYARKRGKAPECANLTPSPRSSGFVSCVAGVEHAVARCHEPPAEEDFETGSFGEAGCHLGAISSIPHTRFRPLILWKKAIQGYSLSGTGPPPMILWTDAM